MYRIIQVVDTLNPGGSERVAVDLANGLKLAGHSVFFCVTRHDGTLRSELDSEIIFLNLLRKKSYQGLRRFRKFVDENQVSIVHAHGNSTALFCVLSLWGMNSVRIIHHDHNPLLNLRNVWVQKMVLGRVHAWIAVSEEILRWVIGKIRYSNAIMMVNPIQVSRFFKTLTNNTDIKQFILLANYREQKDYENLIQAVKIMSGESLKFKINCFGSHSGSEYYLRMQALVNELNVQDLISLNLSVMNIPEVLSLADVGVLTSESEGLPISLLEYMASFLPVVVTDVGECKRIVSEADCGIVSPTKNPEALAEALIKMMQSEEKWSEWGENGRRYIEQHHSLDAFVEKMIQEVYQKL